MLERNQIGIWLVDNKKLSLYSIYFHKYDHVEIKNVFTLTSALKEFQQISNYFATILINANGEIIKSHGL